MRQAADWMKLLAALFLVVAFVLPLSRCAQESPPEAGLQAGAKALAPERPKVYHYYYAWADLEVGQPAGWLFLLVFFWPAAFLAFERFGRDGTAKRALLGLEPLLALGSGYWLYLRTFLRELWIGGYLAYLGFGLLLVASGIHFAGYLRGRNRLKREGGGSG